MPLNLLLPARENRSLYLKETGKPGEGGQEIQDIGDEILETVHTGVQTEQEECVSGTVLKD